MKKIKDSSRSLWYLNSRKFSFKWQLPGIGILSFWEVLLFAPFTACFSTTYAGRMKK